LALKFIIFLIINNKRNLYVTNINTTHRLCLRVWMEGEGKERLRRGGEGKERRKEGKPFPCLGVKKPTRKGEEGLM
jgi:hypothetical protein